MAGRLRWWRCASGRMARARCAIWRGGVRGCWGCCVELIKWIGSSNRVYPGLNIEVPTNSPGFIDAERKIFPANVARLHELARGATDGRCGPADHAAHPI